MHCVDVRIWPARIQLAELQNAAAQHGQMSHVTLNLLFAHLLSFDKCATCDSRSLRVVASAVNDILDDDDGSELPNNEPLASSEGALLLLGAALKSLLC